MSTKTINETKQANITRILDIALQAGVSTATVDRVLNKRPGVRDKTIAKVLAAMEQLDKAVSRPRVIPTVTADIRIEAIIAGGAGFANDLLAQGLQQASEDSGVRLQIAYPHRMNPEALAEALQACIDRRVSGIIVQALDHPLVRNLVEEAHALGIPVISLLTSLPQANILGYIGLDNRAAGRTAGLLMGRLVQKPAEIALFVGGPLYRSHEEREMGFRSVLRNEFTHLSLLPVFQGLDNPDNNYKMAKELLDAHKNLRGILNVGGGNRGIERALVETGRQADINYLCFNLTPLTRSLLVSGIADAVVHQNMQRAAHNAVDAIVNSLMSRPTQFNQVPVEIIMRENV